MNTKMYAIAGMRPARLARRDLGGNEPRNQPHHATDAGTAATVGSRQGALGRRPRDGPRRQLKPAEGDAAAGYPRQDGVGET